MDNSTNMDDLGVLLTFGNLHGEIGLSLPLKKINLSYDTLAFIDDYSSPLLNILSRKGKITFFFKKSGTIFLN